MLYQTSLTSMAFDILLVDTEIPRKLWLFESDSVEPSPTKITSVFLAHGARIGAGMEDSATGWPGGLCHRFSLGL